MKPTDSLQSEAKLHNQSGFSLTEMVAGLFVASLLVVGLADLTRRVADGVFQMKELSASQRALLRLQILAADFARADPDSIVFSSTSIRATLGSLELSAGLSQTPNRTRLEWSTPTMMSAIALGPTAKFVQLPTGDIALVDQEGEPPIAIFATKRTLAFDCYRDQKLAPCP